VVESELGRAGPLRITGACRFAIRRGRVDDSNVKTFRDATAIKNSIALRRLDMPLTLAVAVAHQVAGSARRLTYHDSRNATPQNGRWKNDH